MVRYPRDCQQETPAILGLEEHREEAVSPKQELWSLGISWSHTGTTKRGVLKQDMDPQARHKDAAKMPPKAERRGEILWLLSSFMFSLYQCFPLAKPTEMLED